MSTVRVLAFACATAACSGNSDKPRETPPPPADAGVVIDGITTFGSPDPNAHVDDDPSAVPPRPTTKRPGRQIEILLRSTPSGAMVSVDGLQVGHTPTYWVGDTGAEHEFTFSMPKHALARYRFFPIATGTLHARLDPVATYVDAGVPPPGLVQPSPIPPPETLVAPVPTLAPDAAVAPVAPVDAAADPIGPLP